LKQRYLFFEQRDLCFHLRVGKFALDVPDGSGGGLRIPSGFDLDFRHFRHGFLLLRVAVTLLLFCGLQ